MATLAELQALKAQYESEIAQASAKIAAAENAIKIARRNLESASTPAAQSQFLSAIENLNQQIKVYQTQLQNAQTQLAIVNNAIQNLQTQPVARQSTGDTVRQAQQANANGADVQSPDTGPQVVTAQGRVTPAVTDAATNAQRFTANAEDIGTNDPVRKQAQLMSTPGTVPAPGPVAPSPSGPFAGQTVGVASRGDDNTPAATGVRAQLENLFGSTTAGPIEPQDNVLAKYANYTYNISIYMMSQKQYENMLTTHNKNIAGFQLLMRSGGIAQAGGTQQGNTGVIANVEDAPLGSAGGDPTGAAQTQLGRNQFFPLDYYLDDLRITSVMQGKGSGSAHNATSMSFRIIEPNGISLFGNLYRAAQQYNQLQSGVSTNADTSYVAQNYLMVIRFYGYDENGNLAKPTQQDQLVPGTDPNAVVEKFIPFQFTGIRFRVANKITEYECTAVCPQFGIGLSQGRGVIPYNMSLSGTTIRGVLTGGANNTTTTQSGNTQTDGRQGQQADIRRVDNAIAAGQTGTTVTAGSASQIPAPPNATSAPITAVTNGLVSALNKAAADLTVGPNKKFTFPDTYEIVFPQGAEIIADAKVMPPGSLNKQAIAFNNKTGATAADLKDPTKNTPNTAAKPTNASAGISIMQFMDQLIRTSSYIYDQQTKIVDPKNPNAPPTPQGSATGVKAWYNISVEARPKQYDPLRNDFAYHITYRITPYKVNDLRSDWFPLSEFQGTQKQYQYWFTGQNSEILDLQQDFNYLYYLVASGSAQQSIADRGLTQNKHEYIKRMFQPTSNQSSQGITNSQVNEPSANAADSLYSPSDQATIQMRIVGDPAWIQQGELWAGVTGLQMNYDPFLPDGTINFAAQEALFEVLYNRPTDYNLQTGLMDVSKNNVGSNRNVGDPGEATESFVYRARTVDHIFSRGRFEQMLDGTIVLFPLISDQQKEQNTRTISNVEDAALGGSTGRVGTQPLVLRQGQVSGNPPSAFDTAVNQAIVGKPTQNVPSDDAALAQTLPAASALPPTSDGQVVGPAATTATNAAGISGTTAFGTNIGTPSVQVATRSGQQVTATSQNQLATLYNSGQIDTNTYNTSAAVLAVRQQQTNSPVTNTPAQQIKKENG